MSPPRKRSKYRNNLEKNLVAKELAQGDYFIFRVPNTKPRQELTLGYVSLEEANAFAAAVNGAGWPANLSVKNIGGVLEYTYTRPDDGTAVPLQAGSAEDAIAATVQANQLLSPAGDALQQIMSAPKRGTALPDFIERYQKEILPERRINGHPMSPRTIEEYNRHYRNMRADHMLQQLTLKRDASAEENLRDQEVIAEYLNSSSTSEVFNKRRMLLVALYEQACSEAKANTVIPANILPRDKAAKVRKRVATPRNPGEAGKAVDEGFRIYDAIFEKASFATKVAMELALNVLQRRTDIQRWRIDWSHQNDDGWHVFIMISKTHKHGVDSFIRVPHALPFVHSGFGCNNLGELVELVKAHARKEGVITKHLVYEQPRKARDSKEKEHPFQRSPKQISDDYRAARDAAGVYDHLEPKQRPTLHEWIAFGEHVLKIRYGWSEEQIQQLRGHTTTKTTKVYLEGHEYKTVIVPGINA